MSRGAERIDCAAPARDPDMNGTYKNSLRAEGGAVDEKGDEEERKKRSEVV